MKNLFGAAMRKAALMTRRQNVAEATLIIQDALMGNEPQKAADANRIAPARPRRDADPIERPAPRDATAMSTFAAESAAAAWKEARQWGFTVAEPQPKQAPARKAPAEPSSDCFLTRSYASDAAGGRDYKLYVPSGGGGKLPLIVMLHGCSQDPDDFALGTGMNRLAQEKRFIVAYPKQSKRANQSGCWNWFNAGDQIRDAGEPCIIAGMTREIMAEFDIDPRRVYVAGLSAGGAMAAIMGETYPELYRAAGIHSGLAYRSASDMASAFVAMRGIASPDSPERAAKAGVAVRTIVFHGATDQTVHPSNADKIVAAARAGLNGATQETHHGRSAGGRAYARTVIADASGAPQIEYWAIDGLGHAWSGGSREGSYTDPKGPDASREMLRFFLDKPMKQRPKPHA